MVVVLRRSSAAFVAAVLISALMLPVVAHARATKGTAEIKAAQRNLLAGTAETPFEITVTNPPTTSDASSPAGVAVSTALNYISLLPPADLFVPVSANATGWDGRVTQSGRVVFEGIGDTRILPGQSAKFIVTATALRPTTDTSGDWEVKVSDDNGQRLITQAPAAAGALTTTVGVLDVLSVTLDGPVGVLDNTVTEGQSNAEADVVVQNAGSGTLDVAATLAKATGTSDATPTAPASQFIGPESQATFSFPLEFGSPGSVTLVGGASATGASAFTEQSPAITIVEAAAATYIDDTLQPIDVRPGTTPYTFVLGLDKTGDVAVDSLTGTLSFPGFSTTVASPGQISAGDQSVTLDFTPAAVGSADGTYTPGLTLTGTDENGAPVSLAPAVGDPITVDGLAPVVLPTLSPPSPQVPGAEPAITDGATLTFGGAVEESQGETVPGIACATCTIQNAYLRQYDALGQVISGDIPVTVTQNAGTLAGTYTGSYDPQAREVALHVIAVDAAGNDAEGVSPRVDVDNSAPAIDGCVERVNNGVCVAAITGGQSGTDASTIQIELSEPVAPFGVGEGADRQYTRMAPSDWRIDGNLVQDVTLSGNDITLTLADDLGQDDEPTITYMPTPATRVRDRVGLVLEDGNVTAVDGIVPGGAVLDQVSGLGASADGLFYTNDSTPAFQVTDVAAGHTVTVLRNDGQNTSLLGTEVAQGPSVTINSASLGTIDGPVSIDLLVQDGRGNPGPTTSETLVLDFVAPSANSATQSGRDVTLTFDEIIARGRDFASDWLIATDRGYQVGEVTGSGTSRTLTIDNPDYDPIVTLTKVRYDYEGPLGRRYQDRAGNDLINFILSF